MPGDANESDAVVFLVKAEEGGLFIFVGRGGAQELFVEGRHDLELVGAEDDVG